MNETYRAGLRDDGRNLWVEGYKFDMPVKRFFNVELTENAWHNLGINLNFDAKYVPLIILLTPLDLGTYSKLGEKVMTA